MSTRNKFNVTDGDGKILLGLVSLDKNLLKINNLCNVSAE